MVFELDAAAGEAPATVLAAAARERGVLVNALGPAKMRLVTHLDVTRAQCLEAAAAMEELLAARARAT